MTTFTVNTLNDSDPSDGKLSLREALVKANATTAADTITFAAGLEGKTLVLTQGQLEITTDVTITGDPDHDGLGVTIDQRTDNLNGTASQNFDVSGDRALAVISGLTITSAGRWSDESTSAAVEVRGGALLTLESCILDGNTNDGGICSISSYLHLKNTTISNNYSQGMGGGIFAENSNVIINHCNIINNAAVNWMDDGGWGGGLYLRNCVTAIENSIVSGNVSFNGAGIWIDGGRASISHTAISSNNGKGGDGNYGGHAGGIYAANAVLSIESSTITNNKSTTELSDGDYFPYCFSGSGIATGRTAVYMSNSIVVGNIVLGYDFYNGRPNAIFRSDISGGLAHSDGHNLIGTIDAGFVPGDILSADPLKIFRSVDPIRGGGALVLENGTWVVPLRDALNNPALAGADPATAGTTDQVGHTRPAPAGTAPDIGAYELAQKAVSRAPTNYNDTLTGNSNANTIDAKGGADFVKGLGGNDTLLGKFGSDTLDGGDGNDVLNGGMGSDRLLGGAGSDTISYADDIAGVRVDLKARTATDGWGSIDQILGNENVTGSAFADTLIGDGLANRLLGGAGADTLIASAGNDVLIGGLGRDTMSGGSGNDRFDFDTAADSGRGANADWITDFTGVGASVADRVDLADVYAGTLVFKGTSAFTGLHQVRVTASGADTIVQVNLSGTTAPEMEIHVQDSAATPGQWVAGDFIL